MKRFSIQGFRVAVALAACWLSVGSTRPSRAADVGRPNVVFIISDDQGWADIGYHNPRIRTPHLDRLAEGGVRLSRHYVNPTCSPTRAALMAGRYASRFGILTPMGSEKRLPQAQTLPRMLAQAGYSTHISGKWHLGSVPAARPLNYGFESSYGYLRGQVDPYTHRYKFGDKTWHRNDEFIKEEGHATDLITDEAVRIIHDRTGRDEPYFLYVAYSVPHYPLDEPDRWVDEYQSVFEDPWRRLFAASVTHMDAGIGRIVAALDESGERERTLLVFISDNGGQRSWSAPDDQYDGRYAAHETLGNNDPLRGWKGQLYEGGIRVPALVNWPNVLPAGETVDAPTHAVDWLPTLVGLASGKVDPAWPLDGQDIWPLITGGAQPQQRTFYWRTPGRVALRHGDWKLITDDASQQPELFDLSEDPHEQNDVAEQQSKIVADLTERLLRERARDGQ